MRPAHRRRSLAASFVVSNVGEFSRTILGSHFKHNNVSLLHTAWNRPASDPDFRVLRSSRVSCGSSTCMASTRSTGCVFSLPRFFFPRPYRLCRCTFRIRACPSRIGNSPMAPFPYDTRSQKRSPVRHPPHAAHWLQLSGDAAAPHQSTRRSQLLTSSPACPHHVHAPGQSTPVLTRALAPLTDAARTAHLRRRADVGVLAPQVPARAAGPARGDQAEGARPGPHDEAARGATWRGTLLGRTRRTSLLLLDRLANLASGCGWRWRRSLRRLERRIGGSACCTIRSGGASRGSRAWRRRCTTSSRGRGLGRVRVSFHRVGDV